MQAVLTTLVEGHDLSPVQAAEAMELIASGRASEPQIASLLTALRIKGESAEEIASFARVLRRHAVTIAPKVPGVLVDTCGTGGDRSGTFNISTAAAIVAAGAGVPVAKHGNRKASSSSGSADVMEALGVRVDLSPAETCSILEETGFGFLFAPAFHPALKHAARTRRDLGFSTAFNLLGPLLNPAGARSSLCGVYRPDLVFKYAQVHKLLGADHAMVVHGDGLDEITVSGETRIAELRQGTIKNYTISPEEFGIRLSPVESLAGHSPEENAAIIRGVLAGNEGPARDIVIMNAAAAIILGEKSGSLRGGITIAEKSIDTGAAAEKLAMVAGATGGRT